MSQTKNRDYWIGSICGDYGSEKSLAFEARNLECKQLYEAMQNTAKIHLQSHPQEIIFQADLNGKRGRFRSISDIFIRHLPVDFKEDFQCTACLRFMHSWGALSCVDRSTGSLIPLFWDPAAVPLPFKDAVKAVADVLKDCSIHHLYSNLPGSGMIGVAKATKVFKHMHFDFNGLWNPNPKKRICLVSYPHRHGS